MSGPTSQSANQLSIGKLLTFSIANLPLAALTTAIAIYLPRHFASHVGVSLMAVGSAFFIVRMIDIVVDLALGLAMDRTRTRLGRYRLWLMIGAPVVMVSVYQLFMAPVGVTLGYIIGWLLAMYLGTSIMLLAHGAWATTLSPSYAGRARIFGAMAAIGVVGSLAIFLTPVLLGVAGESDAVGVPAMGWFLIVSTPLAVGIVVASTGERIRPDAAGAKAFRLRDYWELATHRSMGRIIIADFGLALGPGWLSATVLFLLIDARSFSLAEANLLLALAISAGFLGAPLIARLAVKISKHRAVQLAAVGYAASVAAIVLVPPGAIGWAAPTMFVMGFFNGGLLTLVKAMTADVSDELRLEQGRERAGLLFAITTLTAKVATAFSIFLVFSVLDRIGYDARQGAENTQAALDRLEFASVAGPIVFVLLGALSLIGYRLDARRHAEIRAALSEVETAEAEEQRA